jgi:DNA (cytosine-5)-methyltransferase 1
MLENVKNIVAHDKKKTFKIIMTILDELGYKVTHKVIDGKYYVPQHRERTYIVGFDRKMVPDDFEFQFPEPEKTVKPDKMPKLKDILEKKC